MTQPINQSTPFISIHNRRTCYLKQLSRVGLMLGLVVATLTPWQTAWAGRPTTKCEPTMTQSRGQVYSDDSPKCLQFGTDSVSSATVWNMCDVDVIVTQVVGTANESGRDEITYVIQPSNGASIDLPDGQSDFKWSLADGRSGTLRVEFYPYELGSHCTTYGCNTMATQNKPIPSLLLIFIVSLGILRRRTPRR